MSPYRIAARIDLIYRLLGAGLAVEMMARGVLTWLATLDPEASAYQFAAAASLPFVLIGGVFVMVCHLTHAEVPWRYWLGIVGHFFGFLWAFIFGGAILISWAAGLVATALAAPMFLLGAGVHLAFLYSSVKGAKWMHRPLS